MFFSFSDWVVIRFMAGCFLGWASTLTFVVAATLIAPTRKQETTVVVATLSLVVTSISAYSLLVVPSIYSTDPLVLGDLVCSLIASVLLLIAAWKYSALGSGNIGTDFLGGPGEGHGS